jgi:hypothetical protein
VGKACTGEGRSKAGWGWGGSGLALPAAHPTNQPTNRATNQPPTPLAEELSALAPAVAAPLVARVEVARAKALVPPSSRKVRPAWPPRDGPSATAACAMARPGSARFLEMPRRACSQALVFLAASLCLTLWHTPQAAQVVRRAMRVLVGKMVTAVEERMLAVRKGEREMEGMGAEGGRLDRVGRAGAGLRRGSWGRQGG